MPHSLAPLRLFALAAGRCLACGGPVYPTSTHLMYSNSNLNGQTRSPLVTNTNYLDLVQPYQRGRSMPKSDATSAKNIKAARRSRSALLAIRGQYISLTAGLTTSLKRNLNTIVEFFSLVSRLHFGLVYYFCHLYSDLPASHSPPFCLPFSLRCNYPIDLRVCSLDALPPSMTCTQLIGLRGLSGLADVGGCTAMLAWFKHLHIQFRRHGDGEPPPSPSSPPPEV